MLTRRTALFGMLAAPAIVRTPGLLMPVRRVRPDDYLAAIVQKGEKVLLGNVCMHELYRQGVMGPGRL